MDSIGIINLAQSASANATAEISNYQMTANLLAALAVVAPTFTDEQLAAFNDAVDGVVQSGAAAAKAALS